MTFLQILTKILSIILYISLKLNINLGDLKTKMQSPCTHQRTRETNNMLQLDAMLISFFISFAPAKAHPHLPVSPSRRANGPCWGAADHPEHKGFQEATQRLCVCKQTRSRQVAGDS